MSRGVRLFSWSMVDQAAVSGGNFLAIFLGAALLPVAEQAKLVYVFSCYFGLVLLNVASYFGAANTVLHMVGSAENYRRFLARRQCASGFALASMLAMGLFVLGERLGVAFDSGDAVLVAVFLASQQLTDFVRRCGYVFATPRDAAKVSLFAHGGRALLLLGLSPDTFEFFLLAVSAPAVAVCVWLVVRSDWLLTEGDSALSARQTHWRLSFWLILDAPLKWIGVHAPIFLVGLLHSGQAAAILGTVRALMSFANVFLEQLETVVPRMLAARSQAGRLELRTSVAKLIGFGLVFWSLGLLALWLLQSWIVQLFDAFYRPWYALTYLLWSANGVYFLAKMLALESRARKDTRMEFVGSAFGVLALGASVVLLPELDAWGGAMSLVLVQLGVLAGVLANKLYRASGA